jgi:hypothetical protein
MPKTIRFRLKRGGGVEIEVEGVQGSSCKELTAPFEEALGDVTSTEEKPEYQMVEEEIEVGTSQ